MMQAIRAEFRYNPRDEMGTQDPLVTLTSASGTCRDFALFLMEAVRSLGFAARFVSGYLYDDDRVGDGERDSVVGGGATHAWVQIYLPGARLGGIRSDQRAGRRAQPDPRGGGARSEPGDSAQRQLYWSIECVSGHDGGCGGQGGAAIARMTRTPLPRCGRGRGAQRRGGGSRGIADRHCDVHGKAAISDPLRMSVARSPRSFTMTAINPTKPAMDATISHHFIPPRPPIPATDLSLFGFLRAVRTNALTMWTEAAYREDVIVRHFLGRTNLLLNAPDAIHRVLVENPGNYRRSPASIRILRPITGRGLLLSDGEDWRLQRRTIAPALAPRTMPILARHIVGCARDAIPVLAAAVGEPVDLLAAMQTLALDIAGRSMFSLETRQYGAAMRRAMTEYGIRYARPHLFDMLLPPSIPTLRDLGRRRFQRRWMRLMEQIMRERLAAPASETPRDLFDLLLAARDPETGVGFSAGTVARSDGDDDSCRPRNNRGDAVLVAAAAGWCAGRTGDARRRGLPVRHHRGYVRWTCCHSLCEHAR